MVLIAFSVDIPESLENISEKVKASQIQHHKKKEKDTDDTTLVDARSQALLSWSASLVSWLQNRFETRSENDTRVGKAILEARYDTSGLFTFTHTHAHTYADRAN